MCFAAFRCGYFAKAMYFRLVHIFPFLIEDFGSIVGTRHGFNTGRYIHELIYLKHSGATNVKKYECIVSYIFFCVISCSISLVCLCVSWAHCRSDLCLVTICMMKVSKLAAQKPFMLYLFDLGQNRGPVWKNTIIVVGSGVFRHNCKTKNNTCSIKLWNYQTLPHTFTGLCKDCTCSPCVGFFRVVQLPAHTASLNWTSSSVSAGVYASLRAHCWETA